MVAVFPDAAWRLGDQMQNFLSLGRFNPEDRDEPVGMTALAMRMSRSINGVSGLHASVARGMWQGLFPGKSSEEVPITHVTNGIHVPTWISPMMRRLLDEYLIPGWHTHGRITDPATWAAVDRIPDAQLWAVRQEYGRWLAHWVRSKTVTDRLARGDAMDYAMKAATTFDAEVLTLGFARRLATYKRLHLLTQDRERMLSLLVGPRPIQLLFAGKAHPRDDDAKRVLARMFDLKSDPRLGGRVAFLEDYDIGLASILTNGCGVWINLPRPHLEASGTSGMKAACNGVLNLSVLDGWWAEAYDGSNGWAIDGTEDPDAGAKDARDAAALFDLLIREIIPMYYDRDAAGIPNAWIARIKASLRTIGPRFCATRMLDEYVQRIYAPAQP